MADGPINEAAVNAVLDSLLDPETGRSVVQMGQVSDIVIDGASVKLKLALSTHSAPLWQEVCAQAEQSLRAQLISVNEVQIEQVIHPRPPEKLGQVGLTVKSLIAVGSGKGGVGKSTLAVSLALGLQRAGCKVGLLDADFYGPSVPHLLGIEGSPHQENNQVIPVDCNGMPVMSIGFLVPADQAVVWRGPMLHNHMQLFLAQTRWGDLDYLIVDMPPGTGDIALSLSQMLPVTGTVIVCTPQQVALLDAVKAISMMGTVKIPVLGVVENMSGFVCPDCKKNYDIFGSGGARTKAEELGVPFLGEVPINMAIRTLGDAGRAVDVFNDDIVAPYLDRICYQLVRSLSDSAAEAPPLPNLTVL